MTSTTQSRSTTVKTWGDRVTLRFEIEGAGPPLVFLHAAGGLVWDGFLRDLAQRYTVYAPVFPGFDPSDTMAIHELDDVSDVVLAYEQALRSLKITGAPIIGHSFGGMLAAELAAHFPQICSQLVLLAPSGLWTEAMPWSLNFMTARPDQMLGYLFNDPEGEAARSLLPVFDTPERALEAAVQSIWALGCVAKFSWPVPDRGLSRRLHRVAASTLVIWGQQDSLIPHGYAQEFARRIPNCRSETIGNCGHMPQVEREDVTSGLVAGFLA
ncbi:alpha/beta hydrolase [Mycobacterium sp. 236(2023)]|uniref:alpha/beta fold hydrolase n=1 Tax=Mycobacterium sp. 236(2023) TaxID=3038163 RepID=UPI00241512C4|nr:alpha/beta hydrolase [Mycobacterium sp. 236(2023)]MDG4668114.1 alpha/beta hydrolase [Mycobacterium sp. 236(2023)]